jgi:hypothetical protein|tara:strand:+ start:15340 stop:15780 length:441 start_codon:yes stop_codon:yes gene_type:complete
MIENFNQLQEYIEHHERSLASIKNDVYSMCRFMSEVTYECVDGEDLSVYNPFDFPSNEKVEGMYFTEKCFVVILNYYDYYEGFHTNSRLEIPRDLVNMWLDGEKDKITKEVLRLCEISKKSYEQGKLDDLQRLADELGYKIIKEEK